MKNIVLLIIASLFIAGQLNEIKAQDTSCYVVMQVIQGGFCLQALAEGEAPISYTWDDGSSLGYFCPNAFGTYCVTVEDANGCTSTACGNLNSSTPDTCAVDIYAELTSAGALLTAEGFGSGPLTYQWSNGDVSTEILASSPGTYCVTMTDETGCTGSSCYDYNTNNSPCDLWIEVDSTGAGIVLTANTNIITDDYEFFWANNVTGAIYPVMESGTYCVTVTSGSCPDGGNTACITIDLGENPDSCGVFISGQAGNASGFLTAVANGVSPYTYVWNTAETTQDIIVQTEGEYCVTISDNIGCLATDCYYYAMPQDSSCYILAEPISISGDYLLTAIRSNGPNQIETWLWDDGATTQSIIAAAGDFHCVTITDANGASCSTCVEVPVINSNGISGNVYLPDPNSAVFVNGYAYLYSATTVGNPAALVSVDTLEFPNSGVANYSFSNLSQGVYIVKAELLSGDYAPTYHESTLFWDEATLISVPSSLTVLYDIELIPVNGLTGNGGIYGNVTDGEGFIGQDEQRNFVGISGATVLVMDINGDIVAYAITDENGFYEINDLPEGDFSLCIDYPGETHFCESINIINAVAINIDIQIDEEGINTGIEEKQFGNQIVISPNPAQDILLLSYDELAVQQISIIGVDGKLMKEIKADNRNTRVDVSQLAAGIYFVEIRGDGQSAVKRLVKL